MRLSEQVQKVKKLMQKAGQDACEDAAKILKDVVSADVYVVGTDGEILNHTLMDVTSCPTREKKIMATGFFTNEFAEFLRKIEETQVIINDKVSGCIFLQKEDCEKAGKVMAVVPVYTFSERAATVLLVRGDVFTTEELLLAEYAALVVSAEFLRTQSDVQGETLREKAAVNVAVATLSYSEFEAVTHIVQKLGGEEGFLVASKIADSVQITRSVIVNALRKLESAGVIETRSLGMKGTYIRILNTQLFMTLKKARK